MSKKHLLWQIEHKSFKGVCYLMGTMHAHDSRVIALADRTKPYIEKTEAFACEIHLGEAPSGMDPNFMLPHQQTLSHILPAKTYQHLRRIFPKYVGNDLSLFERWQPILIQNILTESAFLNDSPESLDSYLWNFASKKKKKLLGLENQRQQQQILQKLSLKWQVAMLRRQVRNMSNMRQKAVVMLNAYLDQNLPLLHKKAKKSGGKARKWLLYERNYQMCERFMDYAAKDSLFAAVGAGHLLGSKGILRLLKKQGAKVKPVMI